MISLKRVMIKNVSKAGDGISTELDKSIALMDVLLSRMDTSKIVSAREQLRDLEDKM